VREILEANSIRTPKPLIDSARSWSIGISSLVVVTIAFGAPYVSVVALKQIAVDVGSGARSAPALANALSLTGAAVGGLLFGWLSDRTGILLPLIFGGIMLGCGSVLSGMGSEWPLYIGHGLMIGLLGIGAIYSPLITYVSRWFYRRRGLALSLVASGQQVAGAVWPPIFGVAIDLVGWRGTLYGFGIFTVAAVAPMIWLLRHPAPEGELASSQGAQVSASQLPYDTFFYTMCLASVFCCVAMAMPMGHLVAFCGDLGFSLTQGANMLALLLGCGFVSRLLWGRLSDSIGGLPTIFLGVVCQAAALSLFLVSVNLATLYAVSAIFGFGFGGIIPGYVLTVRELCPGDEAGWRIATILFFSLMGMAFGGWLAGYVFDLTLDYRNSFALGVVFNIFAIFLIGSLLYWKYMRMSVQKA
jgi:MFS family permease